MKTNLKKLVAGASVLGLIAINALVADAAPINDATAVVNAGTSIVVTKVSWFTSATTCSATITRTNQDSTTTAVTVDSCTVTNDDTLTIAASTVAANQYYTVAFSSNNNAFGTVAVWDTTNNVVVSARVLPILTMDLSNSTVDLGVLSTSAITDSSSDTTITVKTNAANGYVVSAAATDFIWASTSNVIPFRTRAAQLAGTEGFSIDVASVGQWANGTSTVDATAWLAGASTFAVANGAASFAWAKALLGSSTAGTTDGDTIVVNYAAAISPVTEADSYSTTVTYTITGTY